MWLTEDTECIVRVNQNENWKCRTSKSKRRRCPIYVAKMYQLFGRNDQVPRTGLLVAAESLRGTIEYANVS